MNKNDEPRTYMQKVGAGLMWAGLFLLALAVVFAILAVGIMMAGG